MARGIDAIGDPWVLLILRESLSGVRRFDDLREKLGIADNILADRLKRMVQAGLLAKQPYQDGRRTRHAYHPTEAARDALPVLHAFSVWSTKHAPTANGVEQHVVIVCRSCGAESATGESCSSCGERLTTATTAWVKPSSPDRVPVPLAADD
ncbi:winged helix-turn-helix transcriptional regulator [Propionibacteriaceae bacterium Y1923]